MPQTLAHDPALSVTFEQAPLTAQLLCEGFCNPGWESVKALVPKRPSIIRTQLHTTHQRRTRNMWQCVECESIRRWGLA